MALAEKAVSGPSIVLSPADPFVPTCAYVELAAHFDRMSITDNNKTDLVVAVVSRNTALRAFHRGAHLGAHPNVEHVVPTEVLAPGGAGQIFRYGGSQAPGATIFVNEVSDLREIADIDIAVVDAPANEMADVLKYAKFAVYVARDKSDRRVADLARSLPTFGWDCTDVRTLPRDLRMLHTGPKYPALAARLECMAKGVSLATIPVGDDDLASCAAEAWSLLPEIMRGVSRSPAAGELLKYAFARYYDIVHCIVPLAHFKRYYGDGLLRGIESAARIIRGEAGTFFIPYYVETLQQLIGTIGTIPPKAEAFDKLLRALTLDAGVANVRIAVADAATAGMVEDYLRERGDKHEVVSLGRLSQLDPVEHLVLTGMLPAWSRHVLGSGVASHTHVLAYQRSSAGPASEAQIVTHNIAAREAYGSWLARPEARQITWEMLSAEDPTVEDPAPNPPAVVGEVPELERESAPTSLWSGLLEGSGGTMRGGTRQAQDEDGVAQALQIAFTDGRWLLLSADSWVTRLKRGRAEEGVEARQLRAGDTLVVIDRDPRKALLDKLVEHAASLPEYGVASELVRIWRTTMRDGYTRYGTYVALFDALAAEDLSITTIAPVIDWVKGSTIGPRDREDVRRVGRALKNEFLISHHHQICNAVTALRGINVQLGKRIGAIATQEGVAGATGMRGIDEIVDDVSGLTVGDFRTCVEFLKIANAKEFSEVPVQMLGMLRTPDESVGEGKAS
jgi:hypothetical protein